MIDTNKQSEARNNDLYEVNCIITIIINCITCPLTVVLNVLVIMAVKRRPRLQTNTNILLACLAATDVLTGLTAQPSFILWKIFELLGMTVDEMYLVTWHKSSLRTMSVCSCLHLMLVTCERLIAIKFTMRYLYLVTKRNIKFAVIAIWVLSSFVVFSIFLAALVFLVAFIFFVCTVFILCSYIFLYRETLRHKEKIKTQQLPQDEVERMAKESKALKTTGLVVGAVVLCLVPAILSLVLAVLGLSNGEESPFLPWFGTFIMLNSFLNPLIYCWRQREIRNSVFRSKPQFVFPAN